MLEFIHNLCTSNNKKLISEKLDKLGDEKASMEYHL